MSKKKDDFIPGVVPENERKPELEKDVRYYTSMAGYQPKVNKLYTRTDIPVFKDKREQVEWEISEINRCQNGYDGLNGKMYFWFNYVALRDIDRGKIKPDFRTIDKTWFEFVEEQQKSKEYGIVSIKRRRIGASVRAAADVLHDCIFNKHFSVGMNSKSETDSRNLFKHVKFIYQNLPDFLRPKATASDRRDYMEFAYHEKDQFGNKTKKGNQSSIFSVAPTDNAYEGSMLNKLIMDESGKVSNLMSIWQFAEDCLRQGGIRRSGIPLIFGTVGDITKDGKGLMEMWINNEAYKLKRFPQFAYNGLITDKYGNCDVENSVRWVIYERERLKSATRSVRESFLQRFPLCEKDAFNQISGGGVGDIQLINDQIMRLMTEPPMKTVGWMRRKADGIGVDFVPDELNGKLIIYERPDARVNGFIGITDPVEDDDVKKSRDTSEIATIIGAKAFGTDPPKLMAELAYRPQKLDEYYEQVAMLLQWYNDTKLTIELNKGGWRMLKYFEEKYPRNLALTPVAATSARGGVEMRRGVKMTGDRKEQMKGLMEDNIDNYVKFIPSIKLLEQHKVFGDDHADDDLAVCWGWFLILAQSDKTVVRAQHEALAKKPTIQYTKQGGRFGMTIEGKPVSPVNRPRSAIFKF